MIVDEMKLQDFDVQSGIIDVPSGYEILAARAPPYTLHWTGVPRNCANFRPDLIARGRSTCLRAPPSPPSARPAPCQCFRAT